MQILTALNSLVFLAFISIDRLFFPLLLTSFISGIAITRMVAKGDLGNWLLFPLAVVRGISQRLLFIWFISFIYVGLLALFGYNGGVPSPTELGGDILWRDAPNSIL